MGRVRSLTREDIPALARLHRAAFRTRKPLDQIETYFTEIFFEHPWPDESLPSLVYEDNVGQVLGCVGVMPRPMVVDGRAIRVAVSHHFMADPKARHTIAAVELARAFLSGPQDLTLAHGNARSRRMLERLGGTSLPGRSLRWVRVLRPAQTALALVKRRGVPRLVSGTVSPMCRAFDAVAWRVTGSVLRPARPTSQAKQISTGELLGLLGRFSRNALLRPEYNERSLEWLLGTLTRQWRRQALRRMAVIGSDGQPVGWYLYYARPRDVCHVLQIAAAPEARDEVIRQLFYDAWLHRAVAITGRLDLTWVDVWSRNHCIFHQGAHWILAHSRDVRVRSALVNGSAFLTELEGEGWIQLAF